MNYRSLWLLALAAAIFAVALASRPPAASTEKRTPVLVELFTSEGCSSCPPADALLIQLEKTQPVPSAEVIVLSQHVDYWNHIGWTDPFSSADFTARQNIYSESFGNDSIYTPQMVVDGKTEFVGSDRRNALSAIARAAESQKAALQVRVLADSPARKSGDLSVQLRVERPAVLSPTDPAEVLLAVTETNLTNDVARGENTGRRISHTGVVRSLKTIGKLDPQTSPAFSADIPVKLDPRWRRENLRIVAFVQERRSRRILAAGTVPIAP